MSKKFQSKSGLPEALGSDAHLQAQQPSGKPKPMCDIPNCLTRRGERLERPGHATEWVMLRGFGEVVIYGKGGTIQGHVCQKHYIEILDKAGKDQLSCVRQDSLNVPQESFGYRPTTPPNLLTHLNAIEDQLAEQWVQEHDQ